MNGIGTVISVRPGEAEIEVKRESACGMMHEGGCGDCHGCDSALREIRTFMVDPVGVSVGDRVEFSSPSRNILLLSVLVFAVPLLGYVSAYIQSPPGMYVAIGLGAALLAAVFLPDILFKKKKETPGEIPEETKAQTPENTEEKVEKQEETQ
ncbi:MAG: SoxR reducing system RseC family protein [Clostridia bacterium]|nr:SoxR reducing system RseC family protein [Clostridia bacterium]